jgi:hypothetical protein
MWHITYRDDQPPEAVTAARIWPNEGFVAFYDEADPFAHPFYIVNSDVIRHMTVEEPS